MCLLRHTFTDSGGSKLMPNRIVKNDNNRETFFRAEHIRQFFFLLIIYCIYPGHFDVLFLVAHIIADPDPGSGSVLDPYSIGSVDPDPYSESGSGSRRQLLIKKKSAGFFQFLVIKVLEPYWIRIWKKWIRIHKPAKFCSAAASVRWEYPKNISV